MDGIMIPNLHPKVAERLAKLCGLLGSEHEGERAAAALKADRLVRECGLTWEQIIARPAAFRASAVSASPAVSDHRVAAACALIFGRGLSRWETDFLYNIAQRRQAPTPCQAEALRRILDAIRDGEAPGRRRP
jgi:hypothetical protein